MKILVESSYSCLLIVLLVYCTCMSCIASFDCASNTKCELQEKTDCGCQANRKHPDDLINSPADNEFTISDLGAPSADKYDHHEKEMIGRFYSSHDYVPPLSSDPQFHTIEKSNVITNNPRKNFRYNFKPSHSVSNRTNQMVRIPGGDFSMGTDATVFTADGEGPTREVTVKPFYMDVYEVTNAEFARFVEATDYVTEVRNI